MYFSTANMSEDCLTINIVRPAGLNSTARLPVLVWIYGGSFLTGGSSIYPPYLLVGQSMRMVCWPSLLNSSPRGLLLFYDLQSPYLGRAGDLCVFQLPRKRIWVHRLD